ncbi:acyltransferase [Photobacterium sp. BZF1]|uniref:acyltransferase family protein n=1 Tax=Photobacterium sp. BZF1 TaxID=1904457 RepID=UPI001653C176|nr:acyltransferase [Photobacterium sp. BZF1]MBC7004155.1 acyltransferase [Photobacterium sp. BZF1]
MFGTYRLILAFMVVFLHLAGWPGFGEYAVFTFFCLSGYLMTYIMQTNYGYSTNGRKKYFINRLLRIYPLYLGAMLFSVLIIILFSESYTSSIIFNLKFPDSTTNFFENIFLIITNHKNNALVPPAWALTVEIIYYALIGLGLSKNKTITWLWFCFGFLYTVFIHIYKLDWWDYGYFHPLAASLPFSIGALMYHYKEQVSAKIKPFSNLKTAFSLYIIILANWVIAYKLNLLYGSGFYFNSIINVVLLAVLANIETSSTQIKIIDKRLGDLSYPIYLMHWSIAVIVMYGFAQIGINLEKRTELFALVSIPFMLLFGQILVSLLHNPIELLRNKVKNL